VADIQFWQKRKSMEGLSVRTIVVNVVIQAVVLLYLLDNDTSLLILASSAVGLLIEIWKIQKALIVKVGQRECVCVVHRGADRQIDPQRDKQGIRD
jgi:hypothetical protein